MVVKSNNFNEEDDDLIESDFSDGEPYDLEFELNERELNGLDEAFSLMKNEDEKISFFELFMTLKKNGLESKQPLMFGILKRIEQFKEVRNDRRIDYDTFLDLLKRAMKLRNTRKQARLIFDMFDNDKSGFIHAYNIAHVA